MYPLLKRLGVKVLANLKDSTGRWILVARELQTRGIPLDQTQVEAVNTFQQWLHTIQIGDQRLENSPSWRWKDSTESWKGWNRKTSFWHKIYSTTETPIDLSEKWPGHTPSLTWKTRWQQLWEKGTSPRITLWLWRILHRAFFTGEKAEK
ncbi:hypothetical protein R1flu_006983 [Riccia fluitans]|uniref:Reverse transcriptase zinc-binding domain-containing protein n=1 Tax=Riccia fluitans TaxID=41844 RepID=A0ABD1YYN8_9MARC